MIKAIEKNNDSYEKKKTLWEFNLYWKFFYTYENNAKN